MSASNSSGFRHHLASTYGTLVPIVVLYYDFCLTFTDEVENVWGCGLSWTPVLVGISRYLSLVATVPTLLEYFQTSDGPVSSVCQALQDFHQCYALIVQAIVAAFMIMRTYALYGKSRRILALTTGTVAVSGVVAVWSLMASRNVHSTLQSSLIGCETAVSDEQAQHLAGTWACMFFFDTLVFGLTATKIIQINVVWRKKRNFLGIMLWDGIMYYAVMLSVNAANIVSFLVSTPSERGMFTTAVNVASSLLVSRMAFNLRAQNAHPLPHMTEASGGTDAGAETCHTAYSFTVEVDASPEDIDDL